MPPPTLLHVTHWKAGSQWIYQVLRTLFAERIVAPLDDGEQFAQAPVVPGAVYPTLYVSRQEFDAVAKPVGSRHFVIIRDLRDTLVSMYFSFKNVHPLNSPKLAETRAVLHSVSQESGLVYLIYNVLPYCANIQTSWLAAGEKLFRYEDLLEDDVAAFEAIFVDHCGLDLARAQIGAAALSSRFEAMTGGRKRGVVELSAHERKGISGDWRNFFTDRVKSAFLALNDDLLIRTGYEDSDHW